jgi:pimeloyl-ACP methyl ester carboxylesterase
MRLVSELEQWWSQGEHVVLTLSGQARSIFRVRSGSGPTTTLLHGFPSSSFDWAKVTPRLGGTSELLLCDFLGFGASEKPKDHIYSIHEQADLVQELWLREGVESTALVTHDYADTVAQELLARRAEGALATDLTRLTLLNGGIYPDLHRPQPGQTALLDPEQGPQISALINEELLIAGLTPTFALGYNARVDSQAIWDATSRDDGHRIMHLLIRYMQDRVEHGPRWVGALEGTDVPLSFVWGMLDPISGAHIASRIRERLPDAHLVALEDVSHWPLLEAPDRVAAALLAPTPSAG